MHKGTQGTLCRVLYQLFGANKFILIIIIIIITGHVTHGVINVYKCLPDNLSHKTETSAKIDSIKIGISRKQDGSMWTLRWLWRVQLGDLQKRLQ
jgi:hypothetical protein